MRTNSSVRKDKTREEMKILRDNEHLTYSEIASRYGVSKQRVAQMIGQWNPSHFQFVDPEGCCYPSLRAWINDHRVPRAELIRRFGCSNNPSNTQRISLKLRGKSPFTMQEIELLLHMTGIPYETLFAREAS